MITVKNAAFSYDGRNELFSDLSFSLAASPFSDEMASARRRSCAVCSAFCRGRAGSVWWTGSDPTLLRSAM